MTIALRQFGPVIILLILPSFAPAQISLRTVAVTGEYAPGAPQGHLFRELRAQPTINNAGAVSFNSRTGPTFNNAQWGVWLDNTGALQRIAQRGDPAPQSGTNYLDFTTSALSDNDRVAFCGAITPPPDGATVNYALTRHFAGQGTVIAQAIQPAPGTPPGWAFGGACTREGAVIPPAINADGQVAFHAWISSQDSLGIWKTSPFGLELVARGGMSAPGTGPQGTFWTLGTDNPPGQFFSRGSYATLNDVGDSAFYAKLNGVPAETNRSLWYERTGALHLAARSGDNPPGLDSSIQFTDFGNPALNNAGHVAFRAALAGPRTDASNDSGIWSNASGAMSLIAREGSAAPGLSPGINFGEMRTTSLYDVILDGKDDAAFISDLIGSGVTPQNDSALWAQRNGILGLIAREGEGDPAPGLTSGTVFADKNLGDFYPQMNDPGQMIFKASLAGSGVTIGNDEGFWAVLANGTTLPIVREGDVIEVRPGDFRTLSFSNYVVRGPTGGQDGRQRILNDFGEFTFTAAFTDGSQAILVARIPEPSTAVLLAGALIALLRRRRTRSDF